MGHCLRCPAENAGRRHQRTALCGAFVFNPSLLHIHEKNLVSCLRSSRQRREDKAGAVNGIVIIDIGGGNKISSTISMASIKELGLEVGKEAYAVIKSTSVMVGVDD